MGSSVMKKATVVAALVAVGVVGVSTSGAQTTSSTSTTTTSSTVPRACTATFDPNPGTVGEDQTLSLGGFDPDEVVVISIDGEQLSDVQVDATGAFSDVIPGSQIPADVAGFEFTWSFEGATSGLTCSAVVTYLEAVAPPTSPTVPPPGVSPGVVTQPQFTG